MKVFLVGVSVLFFAIVSCNPVDEGQLPPSNTSNVTTAQALQLLQGTWYLDRVEYISGPICAGGNNETWSISTTDKQYSGYKLEFTQNPAQLLILGFDEPTLPCYQLYSNGGNATNAYSVISGSQFNSDGETWASLFFQNFAASDLFLVYDVFFLEGVAFEEGARIVNLNQNNLVLSYTTSIGGAMYYFTRSIENNTPQNVLNLSGSFILDNYKLVESGVIQTDSIVSNGRTYSFTNEIYECPINKNLVYKGMINGSGFSNYSLSIDEYEPGYFEYEVSSTQICLPHPLSSYKVHSLNNNELILRNQWNCNDYEEYHLTKVN
jgi:hypothetical protein